MKISEVFQIPLIPANAGTQIQAGFSGRDSETGDCNWVPAFAGMSGDQSAPF